MQQRTRGGASDGSVVKTTPAWRRRQGVSIPDAGRSYTPQGDGACVPHHGACALEPRVLSTEARCPGACAQHHEKPGSEKLTHHSREQPLLATARESPAQRRPAQQPPPPQNRNTSGSGIPGRARDPSLETTWTGVAPKITALDIPRRRPPPQCWLRTASGASDTDCTDTGHPCGTPPWPSEGRTPPPAWNMLSSPATCCTKCHSGL